MFEWLYNRVLVMFAGLLPACVVHPHDKDGSADVAVGDGGLSTHGFTGAAVRCPCQGHR